MNETMLLPITIVWISTWMMGFAILVVGIDNVAIGGMFLLLITALMRFGLMTIGSLVEVKQ